MLGDIARELRDLDLGREVALEGCVEDLPLTDLQSVHDARNRTLQVVVGEVDEVLVDELGIRDRLASRQHERLVVALKPGLAVVCALLVERQVNRLVRPRCEVEPDGCGMSEVLLGLLFGGSTQSLVVLHGPALGALALAPVLVLRLGVEALDGLALRRLDDGSCHVGQEPRDGDELVPELVEQVDEQTANVRPVVILVRHDHDAAVAETCHVVVFLARLKTDDLLEFGNLLGLLNLGVGGVLHVQDLASERIDSVELALLLRETRDGHRLRTVSLGEDERALGGLGGASIDGIVELGNARDATLLLAIGLGVVLCVLGSLDGKDGLQNAELGDNLLEGVVGELGTASEGGDLGGKALLGLTGERGVLNQADDEDAEVLSNDRGLDLALLLGLQVVYDVGDDLVGDGIHVGAALAGPDAVDERRLEEPIGGCRGQHDVPAVVGALVDEGVASVGLGVVQERPTLDKLTVPGDLDVLADGHGEVVDTTLEETHHSLGNATRIPEPRIVGKPPQADTGLALGGLDLGRVHPGHVVVKGLVVGETASCVHHVDGQLLGEDVHQLDAVAVLATDEFLLLLVVVRGGQEFTEDQLRDIHVVLRMLGYVNGLAVVLNLQDAIRIRDTDVLDGVGRGLGAETDDVIVCVDKELVDQLVEAWVDGNGCVLEASLGSQEHILVRSLNRSDVGVGKTENVLTVRLLAVLGLEGSHGE